LTLGFVTAILPELSFDNVLNFARHEAFSTVEVMCWPVGKTERKYAGVTHIDITTLTKTKAQDILGQFQDQSVSISALGYYPNMLDPDAETSRVAVAHFKKVIAASPKLGLKNVNGFVGRFDFPLNWHQPRIPGYGDIHWPQFMAELMRIGYDGPLCIEVEDDTFGKTLEGRMKAIKVARNILAPFFG
jgi:sugar phosphate isomerase/epimerase